MVNDAMKEQLSSNEAIRVAIAIYYKATRLEEICHQLSRITIQYIDAIAAEDAERAAGLREDMLDLAQQLIDEGEDEQDT